MYSQKELLLEIWGEHRKQYPPKHTEKNIPAMFTPSGGNGRPKLRSAKQKRRDDVGGTPLNAVANTSKGLLPGQAPGTGQGGQKQLSLFNHEKNTNQSTKDGPQRASINYGDIESDNGLEQLKTLHCYPLEKAAQKARKTNGKKNYSA